MAEEEEREPRFSDLAVLFYARRWMVLGATASCVLAAVFVSLLQTRVYEARADLLLRSGANESPFDARTGTARDTARAVDTEAKLATGSAVRAAVADRLGQAPPASGSAITGTDVIRIRARSVDARQAADIANAYADAYIEVRRTTAVDGLLTVVDETQRQIAAVSRRLAALDRRERNLTEASAERTALVDEQSTLKQRLDELGVSAALRSGGAQLLSRASVPADPVIPTPLVSGVLALLAGLAIGAGGALLAEYLDDSIGSPTALARADHRLPIVGAVPVVPRWGRQGKPMLVTLADPSSEASEAYRALRTTIRFLNLGRPLRLLQVTSPSAGEGKTSTVANLAVTMVGTGQRVCVVCCDLRRPRVHEFFGVDRRVGFTSVLTGMTGLAEALHTVPAVPGLSVLAAGPTPPNPAELLASDAVGRIFSELEEMFDIVLVDSPPVLPVTDAAVLSRRSDVVLLVVTAGRTTRRELSRSIEVLEQVDAPIGGLVVNQASAAFVPGSATQSRFARGSHRGEATREESVSGR